MVNYNNHMLFFKYLLNHSFIQTHNTSHSALTGFLQSICGNAYATKRILNYEQIIQSSHKCQEIQKKKKESHVHWILSEKVFWKNLWRNDRYGFVIWKMLQFGLMLHKDKWKLCKVYIRSSYKWIYIFDIFFFCTYKYLPN